MRDTASIGDREFWGLWLRDRALFLRMCRHWLRGDRHEAEDVVSRGALKALEFLRGNPNGVERFQPWALRILYHLCVDLARVSSRDSGRFADDEGADGSVCVASREVPPDRRIYRDQLASALEHAARALPPRLHAAFFLRFVDQRSYEDIAAQLSISPVNARKRIQQARELLRESLVPYAGGCLR